MIPIKKTLKKGRFITIEGVEGVGKSSAIEFLRTYFESKGISSVFTREPGGTPIAEAIRKTLLDRYEETMASDVELLLMFASRAQHLANVICPALAEGKIVVSDRFTDATYAYQGGGRGINFAKIAELEQFVQGDLQPNLTLLLDAPVEIGLERIKVRGAKDRIEQEHFAFFERVRAAYLLRAKQFPHRFKIIDATKPIAEVHDQISRYVALLIEGASNGISMV